MPQVQSSAFWYGEKLRFYGDEGNMELKTEDQALAQKKYWIDANFIL